MGKKHCKRKRNTKKGVYDKRLESLVFIGFKEKSQRANRIKDIMDKSNRMAVKKESTPRLLTDGKVMLVKNEQE